MSRETLLERSGAGGGGFHLGSIAKALKGDRRGRYSIRVNDQYRITFRFEGGDAHDVTCEDYH